MRVGMGDKRRISSCGTMAGKRRPSADCEYDEHKADVVGGDGAATCVVNMHGWRRQKHECVVWIFIARIQVITVCVLIIVFVRSNFAVCWVRQA